MKNKGMLLVTALLLVGLLAGCAPAAATGSDLMADITPAPVGEPAPVPAAYTGAMAGFGWNLLRSSASNDGNLLVSPASVHLALAMTTNGAADTTRDQMLALLTAGGLDMAGLNDAARAALARWNLTDAEDRLTIANSIWFDQAFTPEPAFLQANADHYAAAARQLDFKVPAAIDAINGWVKEATRGVIPTIIEEIPDETVMYLVNAIHFKADWAEPFDANDTRERTFHVPGGNVEADFMHRGGPMQYLDGEDMQGVMLPYKGGRFAFFAILPDEGVTPRDLLAQYTDEQLQYYLTVLQTNKANFSVGLALPRFETAYKDSLKNELIAMGMGDAFDPAVADFSGIHQVLGTDLYIGDVLHKTFCRVDEKGTEAAAVTAVQIDLESMPVYDVEMTFDRPFLYGIVDLESSLPLFVGVLENPVE
jgi:serpin B